MKRCIVIILIGAFSLSFLQPVAPVIYKTFTYTLWKISHESKIKDFEARNNWLVMLDDMAAHNNQKKAGNSSQDSINQSTLSFVGIIPDSDIFYSAGNFSCEIIPVDHSGLLLNFSSINTPPPKVG